jgi:hypothetical protein
MRFDDDRVIAVKDFVQVDAVPRAVHFEYRSRDTGCVDCAWSPSEKSTE